MFPVVNPVRIDDSNVGNLETSQSHSISREIRESECYLTSVRQLRETALKGKHKCGHFREMHFERPSIEIRPSDLTEILEKHTFVGIVDLDRCLSLIQHSTKLYLVNHGTLAYVRLLDIRYEHWLN